MISPRAVTLLSILENIFSSYKRVVHSAKLPPLIFTARFQPKAFFTGQWEPHSMNPLHRLRLK